ncbi:hypothetical protein NDU88_007381 [Pleurodeles waltl]|uniref:Uncharacterized protein n=1 Tax=Pleurodeles waltl TaxID=8319 RepID=A0AAV7QKQ0_PLEWA|nr:hypothetical protein NDU88_007381 [Pleurodeles waltl]
MPPPPCSICVASSPLVCRHPARSLLGSLCSVLMAGGGLVHLYPSAGGSPGPSTIIGWDPGTTTHLGIHSTACSPRDSLCSALRLLPPGLPLLPGGLYTGLVVGEEAVHRISSLGPQEHSKGGLGGSQQLLSFPLAYRARRAQPAHSGAHSAAWAPCSVSAHCRSALLLHPHLLLATSSHLGCLSRQAASDLLQRRLGSRSPLLLAGAADASVQSPAVRPVNGAQPAF